MSNLTRTSHSSVRIFFHALMPTGASLVAAFVIACGIGGTHLLVMVLNNQVQPVALNGQAYESYQSFLVQPLLRVSDNTTLNAVLATFLWGLFGWVVYACVTFVIKLWTTWHATRTEIRIVEGAIVRSSETKAVWGRTVWRLGVSIATVAFTAVIRPIAQRCFYNDHQLVMARTVHEVLATVLPTLGLWILIVHCYTVLLRLYMLRTRILGEILY